MLEPQVRLLTIQFCACSRTTFARTKVFSFLWFPAKAISKMSRNRQNSGRPIVYTDGACSSNGRANARAGMP